MTIVVRAADVGVPCDPARVFGREGPLVLEIGFGNGEFLEHLALRFPEWNIIGIDISPSSVVRARKRIRRGGIRNVRLYCGDGRYTVRSMVPDGSLHRVYINFPDPWPRRRHARRRLLSSGFLELVASRLADEGAIWLTTDHEEYFNFARSSVAATGLYVEVVGPPPAETLETRWARRWMDQDRSIYHALFRKTGTPTAVPGHMETCEMQHALMRGDLSSVSRFEKAVFKRDQATVVLTGLFRSIDGSTLAFHVLVEEDDLRQHAVIEARPKGDEILIGVTAFGKPLSTPGLNEAVVCVTEFLAGCGLEVVEARY